MSDDALRAYLRALARIPRLTAQEEHEVAVKAAAGDEDAQRKLVEANLRFVVSYAKRYRGIGVPLLDLIHEGNLGLMEAARRFDPARNVKFITYAVWWVRQAIMHALSEQVRAFAIPQKLSGVAARFGREVADLTEQLERAPTTSEIANDLSISESDVEALRLIGSSDVSLNEHVGRGDSEGSELGDLIEQDAIEDVEHELIHRAAASRVRQALHDLDDKEREVVTLRFGLDRDGEPRTLQEIGDALGVSRERVRQIESRAKDKLRRSKRAGELRSYLN
ncbi:MAG TPA: RNA polymerase sigma factor RpoD/SigA [Vicinamibacterales bacterium]|jgi:RNA polymerase primary sigma factor|nr:RNA polymerase sigma factor RpoD/SigA [Vicinamibacterales bacterium]